VADGSISIGVAQAALNVAAKMKGAILLMLIHPGW
jgi:hypothetical protein